MTFYERSTNWKFFILDDFCFFVSFYPLWLKPRLLCTVVGCKEKGEGGGGFQTAFYQTSWLDKTTRSTALYSYVKQSLDVQINRQPWSKSLNELRRALRQVS